MSLVTPAFPVFNLVDSAYDAVLLLNDDVEHLPNALQLALNALKEFSEVNPKFSDEVSIIPFPQHPSKRLIFSPTGQLNTDEADIRNVYDAAVNGMLKLLKIGCKSPLLCCGSFVSAPKDAQWSERNCLLLNAVLGAYHALYTPLEVREMLPEKFPKAIRFGVMEANDSLLNIAKAIEEGRTLARDIGGSDPERMAAPKIAEYLKNALDGLTGVTITINKVDAKKYPLMAAVNRAASVVPRHDGRVVHIDYKPSSSKEIDTSLFLVGKGITFDTGGADVKAGGIMAGMHRDKCGAAAIAGLMKTIGLLQPTGLSVSAALAFVRNSVGEESYVADEIIIARSGQRVRIGNTDAEGRTVMADLLCEAKEKALTAKNPFLFTVATLTGHVIRAYKNYTAVMDNGPARVKKVSNELQNSGDLISDIAEISTIRKEDYAINKAKSEYEDLLQCNNLPSSATPRGHQMPVAFLVVASGLNKVNIKNAKNIYYTIRLFISIVLFCVS
ncbi:aminopeptidase W07G4.4 [Schistosoma japonicum]|nr:aminopeptidase W07G4.4 [Schistosoma japonicum]KAH8876963.1 aminopeptidase W07G4.4 [Schistosoma japonicum]KAH8876964.1 aminopeptidase W07G4.4 [Schistosoma japonicum]